MLFINIYLFMHHFKLSIKSRLLSPFPFITVGLSGFLSASSSTSEHILLGDKLAVKGGDVAV